MKVTDTLFLLFHNLLSQKACIMLSAIVSKIKHRILKRVKLLLI